MNIYSRHDIVEILLKVALNAKDQSNHFDEYLYNYNSTEDNTRSAEAKLISVNRKLSTI